MKIRCICFSLFVGIVAFSCNTRQDRQNVNNIKIEDGLECRKSRFYFGDYSPQNKSIIPFSFEVRNVKDKAINISSVDVGCSCVHINSYPKSINPNSNAKIVGYIDLKNQRGHVSKPIFITTSSKKTLLLRIVGNVTQK